MAVGVTSVLGRLRLARFFATQLRDVVVVAAVCTLVVAISRTQFLEGVVDPVQGTYVLILIAAGLGAGASLCAIVVHRLSLDPRPAWIAAALALYGVFVLPLSSVTLTDPRNASGRLATVTMFVVALVIMLISVKPPKRLGAWGGWVILIAGGVVGALIIALPTNAVALFVQGRVLTLVALSGWLVVSVVFLIDGYRDTNPRRARLGLGLLIVAISQLYRETVAMAMPTDVVYPALRVVGMALVLLALLQVVQRSVSSLQSDYDQVQMRLNRAVTELEAATDASHELNHEMKNGLLALAGVVHVLSSSDGDEEGEKFRQLLLGELSRLRDLLQSAPDADAPDDLDDPALGYGDPDPDDGGPRSTAVADPGDSGDPEDTAGHLVRPVLENLVDIRVDQDIELHTEGEPRAATEAKVTQQIVTNLLVNCARHAPGTPVVVRGRMAGDGTVVIEVRDRGPGLPEGAGESVFERGVRDESAGGDGLGLHISRRMAEMHGGSLQLRTVHDPVGCLAVLTLPSVPV